MRIFEGQLQIKPTSVTLKLTGNVPISACLKNKFCQFTSPAKITGKKYEPLEECKGHGVESGVMN